MTAITDSKFTDAVAPYLVIENALAWDAICGDLDGPEKCNFCEDLCQQLGFQLTDARLTYIEARFMAVLEAERET